jgi:hypothetical protein
MTATFTHLSQRDPALNRRLEAAVKRFEDASAQVHEAERQFLDLVNEIQSSDAYRMRHLAMLEGLRAQLLTSFDEGYRRSVNAIFDALMQSLTSPQDESAAAGS